MARRGQKKSKVRNNTSLSKSGILPSLQLQNKLQHYHARCNPSTLARTQQPTLQALETEGVEFLRNIGRKHEIDCTSRRKIENIVRGDLQLVREKIKTCCPMIVAARGKLHLHDEAEKEKKEKKEKESRHRLSQSSASLMQERTIVDSEDDDEDDEFGAAYGFRPF